MKPTPPNADAADPQEGAATDETTDQTPDAQADQAGAAPAPDGSSDLIRPRLLPGSDAQQGEVPASPQDNAALQQVVNKALLMIHGRKSRDAVLAQLHQPNQSVAEVVGRTTVQILTTIAKQAEAVTQQPLDHDILEEAARYVIPELMKVGCAAGIFPFPDPDSDNPGQGNTPFDRQVRLATMEAAKAYGEQKLASPDGPAASRQAQDDWARGIAQEAQRGELDPRFKAAMGHPQAPAAPETQEQGQ